MENPQITLSIIVPIYNVERYLKKCIDSLLNQDISDYEIILVDDESPDACPQICDEYARMSQESRVKNQELPCIRVIHRKNGGLSAARNSGIEIAQGEYLMFVDSDDYIEPNVLAGLMDQVERDNLDVLRYRLQYVRIKTERVKELTNEREYEVYNPYKSDPFKDNDYSEEVTDGVTFLNTRMSTACYAWAFIIKRDLIYSDQQSAISNQNIENNTSNIIHNTFENKSCLFTEKIYFEDTDWTPRMLVKAQRVASTNTVVYNYLQREGSITKAVNRSKQQKVLDDKMRLIGEMQRQAKELQEKGLNNAWFSRMIADTVISVIGILSVDFYVERKEYLKQLKQMNIYPLASKSTKARLINFSPRLAVVLLHIKNSH